LKFQLIAVLNDDEMPMLWQSLSQIKKNQNWKNVKLKGETRDFQKRF
jgi:hypothetical protein